MGSVLRTGLLAGLLWLGACGSDLPDSRTETASAQDTAAQRTREAVITAANPHAVEAGLAMLRRGGSAVDAAIAAHAVLGLVEPQSSGLGGGGFMLTYRAEDGSVTALDGRETAPASAAPDMFLDEDGEPLHFFSRVQSGHGIGIPGTVALYALAHERDGRLPWPDLFQPAIDLADAGFEVSPRLHDLLQRVSRFTDIDQHPVSGAYFFPDGEALPVGTLRRNPEHADTLRRVAREGADAFRRGPIVDSIIQAAAEEPRPARLDVTDFEDYQAIIREPVCGPYRGYRICSMPPPSSGVALLQMLGLLERLHPGGITDSVAGWAAVIDAMKLAYADRDHYVADADFVPVPVADLLHPDYLDQRAAQRSEPAEESTPGDPGALLHGEPILTRWALDDGGDASGTTHLSVVDADGNAVAFTASVEFAFGSQRMAAGIIVNNELTDFAARPEIGGQPVANAVAPGKRPRSSMTPVLVFDPDGELFMVTGSPGGNSIIAYTLKSILGIIDLKLDAAGSVALPNIIARGLPVQVEHDRADPDLVQGLRDLGYPIAERGGENSGIHLIVMRPEGSDAAADPRREGTVGRFSPE